MSKARIYEMPSKGILNSKAPNPVKGAKNGGQIPIKRAKPRRRG